MIAITRFDRDMDGHMSAELDGSWVRYDSHDKVVSELNEQMFKQSTEAANEFNLHHEAMLVEMDKQAAVIKQMRDALHLAANNMTYVGARNWDVIANALLLQPSPEILQAQDERVAEACAKIVDPRSLNHITRGDALTAIRSGEWRSYL